jgi:hypothetical protein
MSDIENIECHIDLQLQQASLDLAKKKVRWNANRSRLEPIVNAFTKIGVDSDLSDGDLNIRFAGDKEKLAQGVRILRVAGFHTEAERPKKGDSSWTAWFTHPDCSIRIWFSFTSSVCRQVKTGTKTVEIDVYETQCGDLATEELPCETALISETESTSALMEPMSF